ncbi:hypothetical protein [Pseudoclavibacter helvolus]|nr:hypothetical protein [Pseudoclavibacter helvolus]
MPHEHQQRHPLGVTEAPRGPARRILVIAAIVAGIVAVVLGCSWGHNARR